jgi:hypothetical protein
MDADVSRVLLLASGGRLDGRFREQRQPGVSLVSEPLTGQPGRGDRRAAGFISL